MNTGAAYAMGQATRGNESKVFDWDKAAEIIRDKKPIWAVAGLKEDMDWTAGAIYQDGEPITDDYTFLASTWATRVLEMRTGFAEDLEVIPCYRMAHEVPHWGSGTKWPHSAMEILMKGKKEDEAVR